jgi:hypothetical protein
MRRLLLLLVIAIGPVALGGCSAMGSSSSEEAN